MADFDPVEIRLDLVQNVDSEGQKSTAAMNEIAAASNKMKAQFEKDIAAQKTLTTQLINELKLLKETMGKKVETGDEKQIVEKQKLAEQIDLLNKKLIEQQALLDRIGKTPTTTSLPTLNKQVGDYARQVNGLKFSMSQIMREAPNFAISPMIGIMSLSNNLPMLQGDITRMIELNKQLKASGQATIPIFKQLASTLFSWQTGLIAGISALMLWGPAIGKWISGLFRAKDALKLTKDEVKALNDSFAKAAGTDLGKLKTLFDSLNNAKKGTVEYYDAKKQIVDQYGNYLKGMDNEIASLNNVKGAYQALTVEIMKTAKAKALQETTSNLATDFLTKSGKQYDDIEKNFVKKFGKDLGKMRFDMFKQQLESGQGFTTEMQRYISEFTYSRRDVVGTSTSGAVQYGGEYSFNAITNAIKDYKDAKNEFDQKTKDAWDRLGSTSQTAVKKSVAVIDERIQALKTEQKQVSENKAKWDEYQKQIDGLEKDKTAITGKVDKSKLAAKNKSADASADLAQMEVDIELKKQRAILELMAEGVEKQKALRKQTYLDELADLDKQQKDYVSKLNDKLGKKPTDKGYVTSLASYVTANPSDKGASSFQNNINEQRLIADQQYVNEVEKLDTDAAENRKKVFASATEAFLSDMEKEKQAINEKYDDWIKQVTEQGAMQAEIDKLNELRSLAIAQVQSKSILKLSTFYQQLYGNIDQLSAGGLRNLQTQLNEVLASAQQIDQNGQTLIQVSIPSDQFDKDGKRIQKTVNMTIEEFQRLKEAGLKLDDQFSELRPFEALIDSFKDYKAANEDVRKAQEELTKLEQSGTASAEELAKANDKVTQAQNTRTASLQKTTSSLNKIGNSGREIVGAANEVIGTLEDLGVSVGDNTKKSIEGVGKMFDALAEIDLTKPLSIVTSAIKFVAGLGTTIAGIFGMASKKKVISEETFAEYERLIDTIDQVISKQKELLDSLSGINAKAQYDESIALIKKQIEATKNLGTDYLNSGADWNSHSVGYKLQENLKRYAAGFNSIGIDFGGLGGRMEGLFDLSPEQLTNIKEKLPEAWAALDDKTREYLQTLIDSDSAIDDLKASLQEAFTGISFDAIKDGLDDLIQSVDTTWADVADSLEEHMQDAVLNMVKSTYLTDALKEWYDQFADYYSDNTLTGDERQALEALYKTIYDKAQLMYDEATSAAGIDTSAGTDRTGSTKGIAQASQDSVDELNGRMTAIQAYIYDIRNINQQSFDFEKESAAYDAAILSQLETIAENTDYCRYLENMDRVLSEIQLKGIKIKS